jgi:4-methyl-5(b-hydroxyethyl)-thiazole monophosphate biosynthesis
MKLMTLFANGFEEIEAFSVISVLRTAGIDVDMIGVVGSVITGGHGVRAMMDNRINNIKAGDYDGIIIPGGSMSCENLGRSKAVMDIIKDFDEKGKLVAAICCAPLLLAKADILDNRKATIYPGMEKELSYPRGEKVVVDRNIITSQGPGTALDFSLSIVELLLGKKKAENMREDLVLKDKTLYNI